MGKSHSTSVLDQADNVDDTEEHDNDEDRGMVVSQSVDQIMESTIERMETKASRSRGPSGRKVISFVSFSFNNMLE